MKPVVLAVEEWKAFCAFQAQPLSLAIKRPSTATASDVDVFAAGQHSPGDAG
jgi:hypothetical protein